MTRRFAAGVPESPELDAFLNDSVQKIAVLPGRGGIGKTKLMRAWSERKDGWQILWASQHGVWHEGSINEIPPTNTLLIVDDAHLYDDLGKIVSVASSRTGTGQLKLLIGTRLSGVAPIDSILTRLANSASVVRFKKLSIISLPATVELAKEVLGPNHEGQAEKLAEVSKDTPLITVVGGKLIARGEITPDLLVNHEDFRAEVFNKFLEERNRRATVQRTPEQRIARPGRSSAAGRSRQGRFCRKGCGLSLSTSRPDTRRPRLP